MSDTGTPLPLYGPGLIKAVIADASAGGGVSARDVWGATRRKDAVRVRQAVIWVARTVHRTSWSRIADPLGRNHATVMHAFGRAERLRTDDAAFRNFTDRLADRARERSTLS